MGKIVRKEFPRISIVVIKGDRLYKIDARKKGTSGKREYKSTRDAAEKRAQEIAADLAKGGTETLEFPTELRVMAQACANLLLPYGRTIADATTHYIEFLKKEEVRGKLSLTGFLHTRRFQPIGLTEVCACTLRIEDPRPGAEN